MRWRGARQRRRFFWCAVTAAVAIAFWRLPPDPLFSAPLSAVLLARDGELLGARIASDGQWRFPPLARAPDKYRAAVLRFEDKRFDQHPGVDPLAVGRATVQNIRAKRVVSGASTITMQLARLALAGPTQGEGRDRARTRGLGRKAREALLALRLELQFDKDEIFTLYASHAPFGGNVVGLEAAAWRYFGRSPAQLSWSESATLAVLPNQPALVTLAKNRGRLQQRRDRLLRELRAAGEITDLDLQAALAEPLIGAPQSLPNDAPHYLATLRRQHPEQHVFRTSLDAELQRAALELVARHARELANQDIRNMAVLVLDNRSFEVLAYVGNSAWSVRNEHGLAVDIVQRPRSTGSILKPLLYAAMLDSGQLLPRMLLADVPMQYADYVPENFDRSYRGAVPADVALAQSLNVPAVRLLRSYGVERFYDLLRDHGMSTLSQPPDHYGLTLILGGAEGKLWDATHMHAALVATARLPELPAPAAEAWFGRGANRLSPGAAWLTLQALLEVSRPGEDGAWRSFATSRQIAWKTGTSWGLRDAWAIGSSGRHTVGVWVGNADGRGRPHLTGALAAAPLLFALHNRLPRASLPPAPLRAMKRVSVCRGDGYLANDNCAREEQWVPIASHFDRQSPYHQLVHVDAAGARADSSCASTQELRSQPWFVLPAAMEFYYRRHAATYRELPAWRSGCAGQLTVAANQETLDFIYPNVNAQIYLPLELDGRRGRVVFEAVHRDNDAELHWHIDGRYLGSTRLYHQQALELSAGAHRVAIVDNAGQRVERAFTILHSHLAQAN
jgi:penicillin-binding protein 1C